MVQDEHFNVTSQLGVTTFDGVFYNNPPACCCNLLFGEVNNSATITHTSEISLRRRLLDGTS